MGSGQTLAAHAGDEQSLHPGGTLPPRPGGTSRLVRDGAALFAGELLGKIAGLAAFAWLARTLAPESYGYVELAVALSMFFALVVDFGFGPIGARAIARDPASAPALAARIPAARLLLSLPALLGMLGSVLVLGQPPEATHLAFAFALGVVSTAWASRWLFQGLDLMGWAAFPQALRMIVFALGVVALVQTNDDLWKVGAVELAAAWGMALYFVAAQQWVVAPVRLDFTWAPVRALLAEAAPVGTSQLVWALNQYLPTILLAGVVGGAEVAWYGGAHRIVMSLGSFVWLYHFNLFPTLVRAREAGGDALAHLLGGSFRLTSWAGIGAGMLASVLARDVCRIAYGAGFESAAAPFTIIAWAMPVTLISGHARFALIATGHQRDELRAQAGGALLTVVLGALLVPRFGAVGGAWAMLASCVATWCVAHARALRLVGPLPFLAALVRPALAAGGALVAAQGLADTPSLVRAAAAAGVYVALALLLERTLLDDLRRLRSVAASRRPSGTDSMQ